MCGRYYVDDETAQEIEKLVKQVDQKVKAESPAQGFRSGARDIHPADMAPVLAADGNGLCCKLQKWGFPGYRKFSENQGGHLIFNARSESVLEKPIFRESILHYRTVIPAAWFYEWNRNKEKNIFYREGQPALFMAGCSRRYGNMDYFVILTTAANASMQPVHDRMPLLLERDEITGWISDNAKTGDILHKTPCLLDRKTDYEQMSLF